MVPLGVINLNLTLFPKVIITVISRNYYPPAVKLKADLKAGKFGKTSEQEEYIRSMRIHITDPTTDLILRQLRIKQRRKELENELQEETAKPRPWYVKLFSSSTKEQ